MELADFVRQAPGFAGFSPREQICLFAWFLHTYRCVETVTNTNIRACFRELDLVPPDVSVYLPRMTAAPIQLVRVRDGYRLEGTLRRSMDGKYGQHPSVVAISGLLADLPTKIPNVAERAFLAEALNCYRVQAYRAAIVMTWNLAFDHVLQWIMVDPSRVSAFNSAAAIRFPKKGLITKIDDFEDYKESETIEVCRTASLLGKSVVEILREKLKKRNIAAHPSTVSVKQPQADDVISDLVNNVVLALT
jgi:hypothetical protein